MTGEDIGGIRNKLYTLFGNKVDLRWLLLWLYLIADHLLLLLCSESILHWLIRELEGILAQRCHEIEALILVACGHRYSLGV